MIDLGGQVTVLAPPDDELGEGTPPADLGVATVRLHTSRVSQVVTLVAVIVPPLGIFSAAGLLWGVAFRPLDLILFLVFYVVTGLGITVGYHRLFAHRSFEAATGAAGGARRPRGDDPAGSGHPVGDRPPQAPCPFGRRGRPALAASVGRRVPRRGARSCHAHVGWLFSTKGMERGDLYGRDLYDDRAIRHRRPALPRLGRPVGRCCRSSIAWGLTGSVARGVEALVWAGLDPHLLFRARHLRGQLDLPHVRIVAPTTPRTRARNNWVVAVLTFGEGWHNNHHAFPRSARHGLERSQIDISWWVIRLLERLRLAHAARLPTPAQIARVARLEPKASQD